MCNYLVTIQVDEDDTLQRVELMNATMFRILKETKLLRVNIANYRAGLLQMELSGTPHNPEMVTGFVKVRIEELPQT